jgi:methyl-accepting chemotaxis protein
MAEKRPYRRKQHFIKKGYQTRFILRFCLLVLVGAVISAVLLYVFAQGSLTSTYQHSRLTVRSTSTAILPAVIYTNLITLGLITVATSFVVLYLSHRIAGPLYRFEKELTDIAEGDLTKVIRLRKKDEVTDMADSLNKMTASLRERLLELQEELDEAARLAEEEKASEELVGKLRQAQTTVHGRFKV